jgi:hypothetical protein
MGIRAALAATILLCASGAATAQEQPAPDALTIVSRGPAVEIRIRGVSLKSVRADDAQNTIAFDFNGPVNEAPFAKLQDELPDWIDMAYTGYDNAVIKAKRPVTFLAKAERDGFSLRIVPREGAPGAPPPDMRAADDESGGPPAPVDRRAWKMVQTYFTRASAERRFDTALRGAYDAFRDGAASVVTIAADWRHSDGAMLASGTAHADIAMGDGIRLLGDVHDTLVNARAVRRLTGAVTGYDYNDVSGSIGVGVPLDGAVGTVEALYGRSGVGARLGLSEVFDDWHLGMVAAYREPYAETAEAVADRAERDYSSLFAAGQIFDGLWAAGEVRATRYGVHADSDVAGTLGFHAGLRYELDGWPLSLTYDVDGEYVLGSHKYAGAPPTPFVPLSITEREVHRFGGAFSDTLSDALWFDVFGGFAVDRYSKDGPYGGAALRYTPAPGFDLSLTGRYSAVSEREGERGNVLSAGLTLTYAWDDDDAPIRRAGLSNL